MFDPNEVSVWEKLRREYGAAITAFDSAEAAITRMLVGGVPIEHLETEFQAERRARANVAAVRRRMHELESLELAADRPDLRGIPPGPGLSGA